MYQVLKSTDEYSLNPLKMYINPWSWGTWFKTGSCLKLLQLHLDWPQFLCVSCKLLTNENVKSSIFSISVLLVTFSSQWLHFSLGEINEGRAHDNSRTLGNFHLKINALCLAICLIVQTICPDNIKHTGTTVVLIILSTHKHTHTHTIWLAPC